MPGRETIRTWSSDRTPKLAEGNKRLHRANDAERAFLKERLKLLNQMERELLDEAVPDVAMTSRNARGPFKPVSKRPRAAKRWAMNKSARTK